MLCEISTAIVLCTASPSALTPVDIVIGNRHSSAHSALNVATYDDIRDRLERITRSPTLLKSKVQKQSTHDAKRVKEHVTVQTVATEEAYIAPPQRRSIFSFLLGSADPKSPETSSEGYDAVRKAATEEGLDQAFMRKVAWKESRGRCGDTSGAGAGGVLQVMPGTAARHGYTHKQMYNCLTGARAGAKEMARLLKITNGDKKKALIGYNCGEKCWTRKHLPAETVDYVNVILGK